MQAPDRRRAAKFLLANSDFRAQGQKERCAKLFVGARFSLFLFSMAKQFFGTDGIRGVPATPPLDDGTLNAVGRAVGVYLHKHQQTPHALIGMDTR